MTSLPQEIIDEIIDCVAQSAEHLSLLRACSLTSQSFRRRSQSHLFRVLDFGYPHPQDYSLRVERLHFLLRLLLERPELAAYPRQLILQPSFNRSRWMYENKTFHAVLSLLENLDEVIIKGVGRFGQSSGFWSRQAFVDKFWKPMIQPRLTTLVLRHIVMAPLELLMFCPQLTALTLICTTFAQPSNAQFVPLRPNRLKCNWGSETLHFVADWKGENGHHLLDFSNLSAFEYTTSAFRPLYPDINSFNNKLLREAGIL
ncbi:hypothetical protein CPB83DRAFT_852740 [Crepidotus variabilis]|uniref:F-box domain-containing protein n=1 Tax=Crepidotus variabilis TaxID=179855 RepID=A0A9P6JRE1_9AGAR|nr:hypothetical protein CPB83DRAFT_852740 [Crepidotus variabilis]